MEFKSYRIAKHGVVEVLWHKDDGTRHRSTIFPGDEARLNAALSATDAEAVLQAWTPEVLANWEEIKTAQE